MYSLTKCIFTLFFSFSLTSCAHDTSEPIYAWWYEIDVSYDKSNLGGLEISDFNEEWIQAGFLSENAFSRPLTSDEAAELRESSMAFHLAADINGDAKAEDLYVGNYKDTDNTQGKLLAIFDSGKLQKYFTYPGSNGFSALLKDRDGSVRWYKCVNCSDYDQLTWFAGEFFLE